MPEDYNEEQEKMLSEEVQDELGRPEGGESAEQLTRRIDQLEADLEAANSERLRAIADFQNFKRRSQQDMAAFRQLATENLIVELLPVLDNFERTAAHLQAGADPARMLEGVLAVERQLRSILESQNLRRIPALGESFDPDMHEAIAMESSEDHPDNTVVAEIEPGYRIGPKIVRPARVRVVKND